MVCHVDHSTVECYNLGTVSMMPSLLPVLELCPAPTINCYVIHVRLQRQMSLTSMLHLDGVVYLELRTTPRAFPKESLDKAAYVEHVLNAIDIAQQKYPSIQARLILSIDRRDTLVEANEVVALATRFRARGVVGVDLCGDPTKGDVSLFTTAMKTAKASELNITVHFAEAECSASETELQTIMSWEPDRLGHVIHVPDNVKRQIASRKGIGLELCLSCNVQAKMIMGSFDAHHFGEWWQVDGPVVIPCVS